MKSLHWFLFFGRWLFYQIMLLILASKSLVKKCLHLMHISLAPQASLANQALQVRYRPERCECAIVLWIKVISTSFSVIGFNVFHILIVIIIFVFVLNLKRNTFWSLWSASANCQTSSSILSQSPCVFWHATCVCPACVKFLPLSRISHLLQLSFPVY